MSTHIEQLKEWWENAEDAPANPGDRIIERHVTGVNDEDTYYSIGTHREGMRSLIGKSGTRILTRAPKPRPAWHDAVAVIAHHEMRARRQVWTRMDKEINFWKGSTGDEATTADLINPVPLIEARVTDEMVAKGSLAYIGRRGGVIPDDTIRAVITAALGLDPDAEEDA